MNTNIQTNQLIKAIMNPVPKNRKYYKYLGREDEVDQHGNYWHKYTLSGILSLDYYATDIYLLFFRSFYTPLSQKLIYKSASEQNCFKIKQQGISRFYKEFIRLIYLQSLLGQQGLKYQHVSTLISDIVRQKEKDIHLFKITKILLVEYNTHYRQYWEKDKANFCQYKHIKVLRAKIKQQLHKFYKYLQQHLNQIVHEETLPYPLNQQSPPQNPQQLLLHVQKAYQHISNIYVLSKSKKKKMLDNMQMTLGRYLSVKISEGERLYIYLSRLSADKQAVLTKLEHYMVARNVSNKATSFCLRQANLVLIRDILALSKKYSKSVQRCYPLIKAEDIIIDQKSLKPILGHCSLIYDALGIHNRETSSIQLKLAASSTPKPIQFEKSYFERQQDAEWALIRKYFIERREKNQKQQEIKNKNEQSWSQNSDEDAQQQKYQGCPVKSRDVQEKAHVWRLICIFYKIINSKHLIQTFYNKMYQHLSQDGIPPFQKVYFERALPQLHNQFCKNPQKIKQYLRIEQNPNEKHSFQNFDFSLHQLQKLLKMQEQNDDSLIQKYRFEKSKSELWVRSMLLKQIFETILKEKYFKRMLNAKKYMIMFSILGIELSYVAIYTIWQGEKKIGADKLLFKELNDQQNQFKKFSFWREREKQKSNFENINKRLNQYLSRKDDQNKYLEENKQFQENIKNIYDNVSIILKNQKQIAQYEQNNSVKSKQKQQQAKHKYKDLINDIKVRASRTFNLSNKVLNQIVEKQLAKKLQKVEDFHKIDNKISKELLKYITKRFYYTIRAYQSVSPFNFAKYRTFILPFLLEANSMGTTQVNLNSVQNTNETQLRNLSARLEQISQILKQHNILQINESRAVEPKMAY